MSLSIQDIQATVVKRLKDTVWVRSNTEYYEGLPYWQFAFVGALQDDLKPALIHHFRDLGFKTVLVRTYKEHFGIEAEGLVVFLFLHLQVDFPDNKPKTKEPAHA